MSSRALKLSRCGLLWLVFPLVACGSDPDPGPVPTEKAPPPEVTVVKGAPADPAMPVEATIFGAKGYVVALDGLGSMPVVGTTVEASTVMGDELAPMEIWGEGPILTGRVKAVVRRAGNVLVAADNGVFHTLDDKLVLSPASDTLSALDIQSMHLTSGVADEVIWIVAADALYELKSGKLLKWSIEGTTPAAITAVLATDDAVYLGFGGQLYILDTKAQKATVVDYDFHAINEIVSGPDGMLHIATSQGLFERKSEGVYTQYTLAEGEAVAEVDDIAFDAKQGSFIVTSTGVSLATGGAVPIGMAHLAEQEGPRLMAFDDIGNLWIGEDQSVHRLPLGSKIGFAEDVRPILEKHCMGCHADPPTIQGENAPAVNFLDYDTATEYGASTVLRISTGQMPPAGKADPVPPTDFEIIKRWQEGGQAP